MVLLAGRGAQGLNPPVFDDMFALNLPAGGAPSWETLAPSGLGPTARSGLFVSFDPTSRSALAGFGGSSVLTLPDTYLLDAATLVWNPVLAVPTTTGRSSPAAALDTVRGRVLVFGGGTTTEAFDDLFAYDLLGGAWSTLQPEGSAPSARSAASLVFDGTDGRAVLFGGANLASAAVYGDLYQLR